MLNGYCISDIHFGAIKSNDLYRQLDKVFFKRIIDDTKKIDIVVISGDLLDHKLSFNSEDSKLCINFINKLVKYSKSKKFAIRIIKGTKNHDLDQLNNFLYLQKRTDIDFKIVNNVTSEIFNGYNILYVPEEYMENEKEYYKDYFSQESTFDMCFVHGTFNHVEFVSKQIKSERPLSNAPIFSYKEFSKFVKGPVLCGHIHIAQSYKKKIFYTGSFTRWRYGEEKDKGFMSFSLKDDDSYEVKFIKNKFADRYDTIDFEKFSNSGEDIEKRIESIKKYKEDNNIKNLRVILDKNLNSSVDSDIIKKYFAENEEDIKVSVSNAIERDKTEDNELEEKYDFIFKNKLSMPKMISKYLSLHDNITISESTIEEILSSED